MQGVGQVDVDCEQEKGDELARRIKNYMFQRNPTILSSVRIAVVGDDVVLSGNVASFHQRQLCISICRRVAGVRRIVDELQVVALAG